MFFYTFTTFCAESDNELTTFCLISFVMLAEISVLILDQLEKGHVQSVPSYVSCTLLDKFPQQWYGWYSNL